MAGDGPRFRAVTQRPALTSLPGTLFRRDLQRKLVSRFGTFGSCLFSFLDSFPSSWFGVTHLTDSIRNAWILDLRLQGEE
jgi:hypothetical protein